MELKDFLVSAKNAILEHGWTRGGYGSSVDGYCVVGALIETHDRAVSEVGEDSALSLYSKGKCAIENQLERQGAVCNIPVWNDASHRTEQEVLDLFDNAISGL